MAALGHTVDTDGVTGDYSSLNALEAAQQQDLTDGGGDTYTATCQATTDVDDTTTVDFDGWTTDATNFITITATADQHSMNRSDGYQFVGDVAWGHSFAITEAYTVVEGLALRNSAAYAASAIFLNASNCVIKDCFVYDTDNYSGAAAVNIGQGDCVVVNTGIVNCETGMYCGSGTTSVYYCTLLNFDANGIFVKDWRTCVLKNSYVGGAATEDLADNTGNGAYTITTSWTEDGSESTSTNTIASCNFTTSTAGSEDLNITSGSSLLEDGTDLSSDGTYAVSDDYMDTARHATTPDVGAHEFVAAAGGDIVVLRRRRAA